MRIFIIFGAMLIGATIDEKVLDENVVAIIIITVIATIMDAIEFIKKMSK